MCSFPQSAFLILKRERNLWSGDNAFPLFGGGKSEWWMQRVGRMVWETTFSREGKTGLAVVVVMVVVV